MKRVAFLLLALLSLTPLRAQQLIAARVEVDASLLSAAAQEETEGLEERIRRFADGFAPDVSLTMTPTEPVETEIRLRLTEASGQEFRGELTLVAYRPIYGSTDRSLLFRTSERSFPIRYSRGSGFFPLRGALPESVGGRRLYYYLTLVMMLYYDSFDTTGGQPFADLLEREGSLFREAWSDRLGSTTGVPTPDLLLPELQSPEGIRLRELWCLYHRDVLDAGSDDLRAGESLLYCLEELQKLRASMRIPTLVRLFGEAKGAELQQRKDDPACEELIDELFPRV